MQYKLCLLCGLPYDLQMTYKIYIKIHENPWIGNVLACDLCPGCVQKRQIWVDTFQHFERPSALVLKRKLIVLSGPGYLILSTAVVNLRFVWPCIADNNNINSQLEATITNFIDNYKQLNMFRAIISPILWSTKTVFTACGIMHRRCYLLVASSVRYTTSCKHSLSAPEDGWNYRPKHVELFVIVNKICYCCV